MCNKFADNLVIITGLFQRLWLSTDYQVASYLMIIWCLSQDYLSYDIINLICSRLFYIVFDHCMKNVAWFIIWSFILELLETSHHSQLTGSSYKLAIFHCSAWVLWLMIMKYLNLSTYVWISVRSISSLIYDYSSIVKELFANYWMADDFFVQVYSMIIFDTSQSNLYCMSMWFYDNPVFIQRMFEYHCVAWIFWNMIFLWLVNNYS